MTGIEVLGFTLHLFWVGVVGSAAVDVVAFAAHYDQSSRPEKYRRPGFYIARIMIALIGGFLVVIYGVASAPAALQIGASTPAIILAAARKDVVPE